MRGLLIFTALGLALLALLVITGEGHAKQPVMQGSGQRLVSVLTGTLDEHGEQVVGWSCESYWGSKTSKTCTLVVMLKSDDPNILSFTYADWNLRYRSYKCERVVYEDLSGSVPFKGGCLIFNPLDW